MIPVILEVQLWPEGRQSTAEEVYFCKEVALPFLPHKGMEYAILFRGEREPDHFDVLSVRWMESKGHAVIRLELTPMWNNVEREAFLPEDWREGTYWQTFGQ